MEGNEAVLGPIDVIVIGYPPGAPMSGDAVPILLDHGEPPVIHTVSGIGYRV